VDLCALHHFRLSDPSADAQPRGPEFPALRSLPVDGQQVDDYRPVVLQQDDKLGDKAELLQGTLDTLVLKTLASMGPLHGYGLARRIEEVSGDTLVLNQGTIYPALLRMEQRGWIRSDWGKSENNRRARFYTITSRGRRQLVSAIEGWQRIAAIMGRFFEPQP
jgi:PadR family transcriptional regulator PadR